ncbi:MAG: FHA domain-containing protein [Oscillospiraceae bacterium]|nr:FHA domain-containing protein [Oscillospiraceae bacterium]
MNEIISKIITYIIILLIYSVVLNVVRLIYTDIHSMKKKADETTDEEDVRAYLKLINRKGGVYFDVEESYTLEDTQTIGRSEDNDIVLGDPFLSKKNTCVYIEDDVYYIEDLGGKNGTYLNGLRLVGAPAKLSNGDKINMGQLAFIFVDPLDEEGVSGKYASDDGAIR